MRAHRIDRQVIELYCGSEEKVGMLRPALTHFLLPELEKVMGKVLDEISLSDEGLYRVDRLEVDLGELTMEEWTDGREVLRRFEHRMKERAGEWISEVGLTRPLPGVSGEAGVGIDGGAAVMKGLTGLKWLKGLKWLGGLKGPAGLWRKGSNAGPGQQGGGESERGAGEKGARGGKGMPGSPGAVGSSGGVVGLGRGERMGDWGTHETQGAREIGSIGLLAEDGLEWEMVRSFLLSGQLPWWADRQSLPDMDILTRRVAEGMPGTVRVWMAEAGNVAVWQRVGGFSMETRRLVNEIAGDTGLPDAAMVMEELEKILAGGDPVEKRFEVTRAVVQGRRAGFFRRLLRLVGTVSLETEAEVLMEVGEVRKRLLERPVLMAMLLLYLPEEVMKREMRRILEEEDEQVHGGDVMELGKPAGMTGRMSGEEGEEREGPEGKMGRTEGMGAMGGVGEEGGKGEMGRGNEIAGKSEMERIGEIGGEDKTGRGVEIGRGEMGSDEKRRIDEMGERGQMGNAIPAAAAAGERRLWFTLKAAERRILEEIVKKRAADRAEEEKLLVKTIKKMPLEDIVLLRRFARLPEEKLGDLLSAGLPVATIGRDMVGRVLVENSGLCLFAPYLSSFFGKLGYIRQERFCDKRAVSRAVHLLQYVATGKRGAPEYLLPLNKILCGLLPEEGIAQPVRLTKKEMLEADRMVEAVVANWCALKNTSANGLRGSFVCREGIIADEGKRWMLRVERKEYDLLLKGVPWGFSYIKLPWMVKHLEVEW
jgi:hypothetical protein